MKSAPFIIPNCLFWIVALLALCVAAFPPVSAWADAAESGLAIAERHCARCHAIAGPGPSPVAAAPAFSGIGRSLKIDDLAEALAEGILTGHGPVEMPEIVLEPDEIDALLAYLHSVQE